MENKLTTKITITIGFALLAGNMILLAVSYALATMDVREVVLTNNLVYIIMAITLPILWWMLSTIDDNWDSYDRKNFTLALVIINAIATLMLPMWTLTFDIVVVRICTMIKVGRNMTIGMIYGLCRGVLVGACGGTGYGIYQLLRTILSSPEVEEGIKEFRIQHLIDMRENKDNLYDIDILQDKKTGRRVPIKMMDRFVHMFSLGSSGTGKTSSIALPQVICDLNKKISNAMLRGRALLSMVKEKRAVVERPDPENRRMNEVLTQKKSFEDEIEAEYLIHPTEGNEAEYESIYKKYPDCGITVMAPNSSMNKDIIRLAKARNLKVNVIDPAYKGNDDNVRLLGINPFYIPLKLDYAERIKMIADKAQTFSEVLIAVNDTGGGGGDTYFRDLNTSVTTNIAIICMLYSNMRGKQTNIGTVQECINDFSRLSHMIEEIERRLHLSVAVKNMDAKKDKGVQRVEETEEGLSAIGANATRFHPETDPGKIPEHLMKAGIDLDTYNEMLRREGDAYYMTIYSVKAELLGYGGATALQKMYDQVRGLRNIINGLLLDPRLKRILSADEMDFIDWDRALEHNEITLINTALEFGAKGSTALGLFLLLNFRVAVVRRPENKRSFHSLIIDEASQYMHPIYEDMFALFRQYRVAVNIMMQSLSQMEKTNTTKYLKGVVTGAGIHIVYGRTTPEEMKYYQDLAGVKMEEQKLTAETHNSEFDANYNITHQERSSYMRVNATEGGDIRRRDFQEATVNMIDNGRVLRSFIAKTSFAKKSDYEPREVKFVNWSKYFLENDISKDKPYTANQIPASVYHGVTGSTSTTREHVGIPGGQPYAPIPTGQNEYRETTPEPEKQPTEEAEQPVEYEYEDDPMEGGYYDDNPEYEESPETEDEEDTTEEEPDDEEDGLNFKDLNETEDDIMSLLDNLNKGKNR